MTREEWPDIKRMLLQWPQRRDEPIDDGAYLRLLRRFSAEQVAGAIDSMLGLRKHTPKASEIASEIVGAAEIEPLSPAQREYLARYETAAAERWERFCVEKPELAAKIIADIERTHGKRFASRHRTKIVAGVLPAVTG